MCVNADHEKKAIHKLKLFGVQGFQTSLSFNVITKFSAPKLLEFANKN